VKIRTQSTFGRYQIEAEIGRGAMGVVYRARDPKIDRLVAIKTISLTAQDPEDEQAYRERFLQEARAVGRLSHPGIVTVFDAGEDAETHEPYLVMEYVCGEPLSRIMSGANRRLPTDATLHFVLEIAEALDYAHSQGVIHRDIKPANILITEEGHAKIADFGVARLSRSLSVSSRQIFGSPAYMAPEQLTRGHADARSDLFSVGVMLYSMLTGFRPFQGNSADTVCFKVMNVDPVPVTSFQADIHPALDRIVSRAIAKDPEERYQSGAELVRDIRRFQASNDVDLEMTALPDWAAQSTQRLHLPRAVQSWKQLVWKLTLPAMAIAALLTAWQLKKDLQAGAEIPPPRPQLQSAPPIEKTPPLYLRLFASHLLNRARSAKTPGQDPQTAQMAHIQVKIMHHFSAGKASVWLDDQLVLEENLHSDDQRHPLLRSLEMEQTTSFALSPGKHQLRVQVVAPENTYDQSETLEADPAPGSKQVLNLNCDRRKMQVTLE
jgi:serine/threonine protein kinase